MVRPLSNPLRTLGLLAALGTCSCVSSGTWPPKTEHGANVVVVEKPCELPEIAIEEAAPQRCGQGKEGWACFDQQGAARLERKVQRMEQWIARARTRCVIETEGEFRGMGASFSRPASIFIGRGLIEDGVYGRQIHPR